MIGLYWLMSFALFLGLPCLGGVIALKYGGSRSIGLAWGLTAWLSLMSGHLAWSTVVDWWERDRFPARARLPKWGIATIWGVFLATVFCTALLFRRLF